MERIVSVMIGYAFGLLQTGYIYGKLHHMDIRRYGSGNAGTTNALRTLGWKAGLVTYHCLCLKSQLLFQFLHFGSQAVSSYSL